MIKIIGLYLAILSAHIVLVFTGILPGEIKASAGVDIFLAVLFCSGLIIAVPGIAKGGENFSIRFLLMTTAQMLLMLALILILALKKNEHSKAIGFSAIGLFVILLAIQSVYLVRQVNKK